MRDSFVFFKSFYESIKNLEDKYQLELYNAICEYSLYGTEPVGLSPIATALFTLMKPNIDNSTRRYDANVSNGKKGGRPKKNKVEENPMETQEKPNNNPNETQIEPNQNLNVDKDVDVDVDKDFNLDMDKDKEKDKKKKANRFSKPTIQQIQEYCKSRNNNVDPNRFYDYYETVGWKVGKNPMKDWKAAIRTWERNNTNNNPVTNNQVEQTPVKKYSFDIV